MSVHQKDKWTTDAEFLLSCVALSVGLGNVWRFPFVRQSENKLNLIFLIMKTLSGCPSKRRFSHKTKSCLNFARFLIMKTLLGGAFLIPYVTVLVFVGKPLYYMELVLGQFSSRGCIKVYDLVPALRGIGVGQVLSTCFVTTYYASLMGLTIRYFLASFNDPLPWSLCDESWNVSCIDSSLKSNNFSNAKLQSSAELFFK